MFDETIHNPLYMVRFYHSKPGDAGFKDQPVFDLKPLDIPGALLSRFNDPVRGKSPPTQADLIDSTQTVICKFRVTGPNNVETVPVKQPL